MIAIIAILAAILFPVFAKAREKAREITCVSNMKQLGLGMLQYSQDNDEIVVPRMQNGVPFQDLVQPYVKSVAVGKCPDNPLSNYLTCCGLPASSTSYVSYGGNAAKGSLSGATGPMVDTHVTLAQMQSPAELIGLVESTSIFTDFDINDANHFGFWDSPTPTTGNGGNLFAGHTGYSNFLFMDGHVKAMRPLATLDQQSGGSGQTDLWIYDNSNYSNSPGQPAKTLSDSQNIFWKQ